LKLDIWSKNQLIGEINPTVHSGGPIVDIANICYVFLGEIFIMLKWIEM